jgi:hypothetical protein
MYKNKSHLDEIKEMMAVYKYGAIYIYSLGPIIWLIYTLLHISNHEIACETCTTIRTTIRETLNLKPKFNTSNDKWQLFSPSQGGERGKLKVETRHM